MRNIEKKSFRDVYYKQQPHINKQAKSYKKKKSEVYGVVFGVKNIYTFFSVHFE